MDTTAHRLRVSRTAFLMAIVSIPLLITTVYLGLMLAGIALMLALLTVDTSGKPLPQARNAILIAGIVIAFGVILTLYVIFAVILPALRSPDMMSALDEYFMDTLGYTLTELMEQYR